MKSKYSFQNVLIALVLVVVLANTIVMAQLTRSVSEKLDEAAEINRPALLSAVIITADDCDDCFDIDEALEAVKKANVKIEDELRFNLSDKKAQQIITQYDIKKLPAIVFTGEIKRDPQMEKSWEKIGVVKEDAVLFTQLQPPYFDIAKNRVIGWVTVTYLDDEECSDCTDYSVFVDQLKETGVVVSSVDHYFFGSEKAQNLIQKYDITRVPAFLLSSDLAAYESVSKAWSKVGKLSDDGTYVSSWVSGP